MTTADTRIVARRALSRWRSDIGAFASEVLGIELLDCQRAILNALLTHKKIACKSGHKTGKTTSIAVGALWFALLHERARVILTASSARQVESLAWYEIKRLYRRAKIPLGGHLHESAAGGLTLSRERQIMGFATDEAEKMAGFSSPKMLFVIDEASGFEDKIYEAIQGNSAGGAQVFAMSNPTKTSGFFFNAFHSEAQTWSTHTLNSLDVAREAKARFGDTVTGLATEEWCNERIALWGLDDVRTKVRVLGQFGNDGQSAFIDADLVSNAMKMHAHTRGSGRLTVGVDLARFGQDASSIAPRRGRKIAYVKSFFKMDGPDVLKEVRKTCNALKLPGEKPLVVLDITGIGQGSAGWYRECYEEFDLVEVNSGQNKGDFDSTQFYNVRADLWDSFRCYLRDGGTLPSDDDLAKEVTAPKFDIDKENRLIIESKRAIRSRLGKSTDKADACALACYDRGKII